MFVALNNGYFEWTLLKFLIAYEDVDEEVTYILRVNFQLQVAVVTFVYHIVSFECCLVKCPLSIDDETIIIFELLDVLVIEIPIVVFLYWIWTLIHDHG